MKNVFTILAFSFSFAAMAQPTITSSWAPHVGLQARFTAFDGSSGLSEGAAGANVTWDLSAIDTIGSQNVRYIDPATAPGGSNFPGATDCAEGLSTAGNNTYTFSKLTTNAYTLIGVNQPAATYVLNYNPGQDALHFPFTYGTFFVSVAKATGTFVSGGYSGTTVRHTLDSTTVDGYGTLTTKAGTFNNVLRYYIAQHIVDTQIVAGQTAITNYYYRTYSWVSPDHSGVGLASINHLEYTQNGFTQTSNSGSYTLVTATGIDDISLAGISRLTIQPQPATDHTVLALQCDRAVDHATIAILDMSGREVMTMPVSLSTGDNHITIPTATLSNGIYNLQLQSDTHATARKLVVAH